MTQRALEFHSAPLEQLQEVAMWVQQLDDDPEEDTVLVYKDSLNKRAWFESIQLYLSVKKGNTGMPLLYLVGDDRAAPADDPGFGLPDSREDL